MRNPKFKIAALFIVTPLFLGLIALTWLLPNDWQEEPPRLLGRVWTAKAGERFRAYYVTEEERAYRKRMGGSGRRSYSWYKDIRYTRYRLESRRMDGALDKSVIIKDIVKPRHGENPQILGPVPNGLWVWDKGIELRDPVTLAVRHNSEKLLDLNPEVAEFFPDEVKDAKVSNKHDALVFKSTDLQYYQMEPDTGKAALADTAKLENVTASKRIADGFYYLQSPGRARGSTSVADFLTGSFGTPTMVWYGLLSEEKKKGLSPRRTSEDRPYGDEWRSLYKTPYAVDDKGYAEIDPKALERVGELKLLNAAFLERAPRAVWDVADPSSSLILHKKDLKKDSPWHVGRLTRDGELVWDVSTGLGDLQTVNSAEDTAVFFGSKGRGFDHNSHELVFVETGSGKMARCIISQVENKTNTLAGLWKKLSR